MVTLIVACVLSADPGAFAGVGDARAAPGAAVPGPATGSAAAARVLGVGERVGVTGEVGVWVPRLTGTAQVGAGGTQFQLNQDLGVGEGNAGIAGEFGVWVDRWRFGGMGFAVNGGETQSADAAGTFGSTAIASGDSITGSFSAWMAGAEAAYVLWRPMADEPWPWSAAGDNRDSATKAMGSDGYPRFDVRVLLLGGALAFHYDQELTNQSTGSSSSFDRTVGCVYGGAGLDIQLGFEGRVPLVRAVRIYANAGVGPSIPDLETVWMVRVGFAFLVDDSIGAEFGYRLFDFDLVDGPSEVDGGLRGLFGGVTIRF